MRAKPFKIFQLFVEIIRTLGHKNNIPILEKKGDDYTSENHASTTHLF